MAGMGLLVLSALVATTAAVLLMIDPLVLQHPLVCDAQDNAY